MARVLTNSTQLLVTTESSIGVAGTLWHVVEFETIGAYGATLTFVSRRPIGSGRGRKKGTVVDLESSVEIETDLTIEALGRFVEGFFFAEFANAEFDLRCGTGTIPPPAVAATDDFTIDTVSASLGAKLVFNVSASEASLVYAKGYTNAANNGIHVLNVDCVAAETKVQVASTLVAETPPTNASLQVCGIQVSDGDLTMALPSGGATTLTSAADIPDWSTLGLQAGMFIHIGSPNMTTGVVQNALGNAAGAADDTFGYARITSIASNVLSLDKLGTALATAADHTGDGVAHILFGRWARDVETDADATDNRYLERTFQFEVAYPELTSASTDYEYAIGNFANELTLNVPLTDKATIGVNFVGTSSEAIVVAGSRKSGASTAIDVLRTTAFNTAADLTITTDVLSSVSEVCFKSLTFTILNNVSPEKCLGTLGASFVNAGIFQFDIEGQMLFTNRAIVNAIRNNTTVTMLAILRNEDGAVAIDVPEMTMGGGGREYPIDQSVLVNITGESFTSSTYAYNASMTLFPIVPWA